MVHSAFEFSNALQAIEIYTPNRGADGSFVGLTHEAVFYDPAAFVEPIRIVRRLTKIGDFEPDVGVASPGARGERVEEVA